MRAGTRGAAAVGVAGLGLIAYLLVFGSPVAMCLGPLGVTGIECARATGRYPSVGAGLPVLALSLVIAISIARPRILQPVRRAAIAEVAGALAGGAIYLVARPTAWTGPTSTGEIITVDLPLDTAALATAAILGGAAGLAARWVADRTRREASQ